MRTYDSLIRVSKMNGRKESAESTLTIDDQVDATRRAITEVGGRHGKRFEALDQSGFTIHKDGVYEQIIDRVRNGRSNGIVVAYGDRLTRNWRAVGAFYDALEAAGGEVIIAGMPGVDYRSPLGRMVTGMMAVAGEVVSTTAQTRSRNLADSIMARGVPNRVPYGYRRNADPVTMVKTDPERDGKALVPHEDHAPIVRRIFEQRRDGWALSAITSHLNEAGVPAPNGRKWTHSSLTTMFRNPAYTGVVRLGERRIEGAHEPLVSKADWKRVQSSRPVIRNGKLVAGIAGGLLECSGCGKPLSMIGSDHGSPSYGCRRHSSDGSCPRPVHISAPVCDDFVHDAVRSVLDGRNVDLVSNARELEAARKLWERARSETEAFVKLSPALDLEHFQAGYADRQQREAEALQVYDDLLAHSADVEDMPTNADGYDALDLRAQRRIVRSLIERIVVAPPGPTRPRGDRSVIEARLALDWKRGG